MRVRIVSYEDINAWILGKFARKMQEELTKLGVDVDISNVPDPNADINHHIIYLGWNGQISKNDSLMITHVDNIEKLRLVEQQLEKAAIGICMSKEQRDYLYQLGNISPDKLCYALAGQDGVMPIKKIVIGFSNKVGSDGRKNEHYFNKLVHVLDPELIRFRIMGEGWGEKVDLLRQNGFEVDYFNAFDYDEYLKFIPSLDYYLYMGMDEGQMGVLDALAAGVPTIITAQGYHLDIPNGITYGFKTYDELEKILLKLQSDKRKLIDGVKDLTWKDYAIKHLEIWKHILGEDVDSQYTDGVNSIISHAHDTADLDSNTKSQKEAELKITLLKQQIKTYENELKSGQKGIKTLIAGFFYYIIHRIQLAYYLSKKN